MMLSLVKGWTTAFLAVAFFSAQESRLVNALSTMPPSRRSNYYAPTDSENRMPGSYRQNRDGQWWDKPGSADTTRSTPLGTGSFQTYTEMVRENKRQADRRYLEGDRERDYAYQRGDNEPYQQRRGERYFPTRSEEEARRRRDVDDRYWSPRYDRDPYDYYGSDRDYENGRRRQRLPLANVHDVRDYNYGDDYNRYSSSNYYRDEDYDRRPTFRRYRNQQYQDEYYNNDQAPHVLRQDEQYYQPRHQLRPLTSVHDRQGPGEYNRAPNTWWDQAGSADQSRGFQTYTDQSMERSRREQRDWPRGRRDRRDYQGADRGYY